jgi:large subunit ribosomal protein L24
VTLELDARRVDGVAALLERIAPQAAAELRRRAEQVTPAKLRVALNVSSGKASAAEARGQFKVDGSAGPLRIGMQGDILTDELDLTAAGLARLRSARVAFASAIEAAEGATLLAILGLDRAVAVDKGTGRINITARGPLDKELAVGGRLAASGLDASATGTLRLIGNQGPTASLGVQVARADIRIPASGGREAELVPTAMSGRLSFSEGEVGLTDLTGTAGGTDIGGRLIVGIAEPHNIRGELSIDTLHLPTAAAAMVGIPRLKAGSWPSEPFERGLIGSIEGSIKLRIANVLLSPQLGVTNLSGVAQFGQDSIELDQISGAVAGGRVAGAIAFKRADDGLSLDSNVRLSAVDLVTLFPGEGALTGRATVDLRMGGNGRSPVALIGSLQGGGTFTVQDGAIKRIDPSVFTAVTRSVDEGLPIDAVRIHERTEAALGSATLNVGLAQGEIVVAAGQLRLANTAVQAKGVDVDVNLGLDLAAGGLDTRLILTGAPGTGALEGVRPEIALSLRGPFGEFKRTLDVAAFANWLALRAIEEKDKRIDALQAGREIPVPSTGTVLAPTATTHPVVPGPAKSPPASQQQPKVQPPRPAAKTSSSPTDIRPPPAVRPQTPPKQVQPQLPASRSWLERLLNP